MSTRSDSWSESTWTRIWLNFIIISKHYFNLLCTYFTEYATSIVVRLLSLFTISIKSWMYDGSNATKISKKLTYSEQWTVCLNIWSFDKIKHAIYIYNQSGFDVDKSDKIADDSSPDKKIHFLTSKPFVDIHRAKFQNSVAAESTTCNIKPQNPKMNSI